MPADVLDKTTAASDRFSKEAAEWDNNPFVHQMSAEAWKALQKHISVLQGDSTNADVLEIGCGTGLLTFMIAPHVREVVAVDATQGMIDILNAKLKTSSTTNILPLAILLEDPEDTRLPPAVTESGSGLRRKYDLIISHLVLHHIPELRPLLQTMLGCLKPGGMIALTDFEDFGPEARKFHPESKMEGVERHGIHASSFQTLIRDVGFEKADVKVAWEHEKKVEKWPGEFGSDKSAMPEQGEIMKFSYVLCTGMRPL